MLELVKLGEECIDNLHLFQRIYITFNETGIRVDHRKALCQPLRLLEQPSEIPPHLFIQIIGQKL